MSQWVSRQAWEQEDSNSSSNSARRLSSDEDDEDQDQSIYQEQSSQEPIQSLSAESLPDIMPLQKYWLTKRNLSSANPNPHIPPYNQKREWRTMDKLKTSHGALVVCLNLDVDPPDVVKTQPCAVLECWVDPRKMSSNKALEAIGRNLHQQFQALNPKIKYKPYLDPSHEETKRFCLQLRRNAKEERVLFYYNGHGVPKPTPSGELWVFNRNFSQYIPLSLQEVQSWLGSPVIYVWDCSAAGYLLDYLNKLTVKKEKDTKGAPVANGTPSYSQTIQLAACLSHETLPMAPDMPADLFTSCLTSPIEMAMRFFYLQNRAPLGVTLEMLHEMPGDLKDRRTPLGELNWIFTAVTDTIAWTTFPFEVFNRLYRQDLLLAALFRNFLLAERIMRNYHCTPHTIPELPSTATHPLWAAWDRALEEALKQLPDLVRSNRQPEPQTIHLIHSQMFLPAPYRYDYKHSTFFTDQLTAFELWIARGGGSLTKPGPRATTSSQSNMESSTNSQLVPRKPPQQLPTLLQVLLSQQHRTRALRLLCNFVDLGPWAVHLVLEIGIHPYVTKLLLSPQPELKPLLIYIWSRLIAYDQSFQNDLMRDSNNLAYFTLVLDPARDFAMSNAYEHRAMCASILAGVCRGNPGGRTATLHLGVFGLCVYYLDTSDFLLKQWACLCLAQVWDATDEAKAMAVRQGDVCSRLTSMVEEDDSPEVRAAALYALGTWMGASGDEVSRGGGGSGSLPGIPEREHLMREFAIVATTAAHAKNDSSPVVRKELVVLISALVEQWKGYFVVAAWIYWEEDRATSGPKSSINVTHNALQEWESNLRSNDTGLKQQHRHCLDLIFLLLTHLFELSLDPHQEVANMATTVTQYIVALLRESPFARIRGTTITPVSTTAPLIGPVNGKVLSRQPSSSSLSSSAALRYPNIQRADSGGQTSARGSLAATLQRTSSFASTIKNLASSSYASLAGMSEASTVPASPSSSHPEEDVHISRPPSPAFNCFTPISPYPRPSSPEQPDLSISAAYPASPLASSVSSAVSSGGRSLMASSPATVERNSARSQTSTTGSAVYNDYTPGDMVTALILVDLMKFARRKQQGESAAATLNGSRPGRPGERRSLYLDFHFSKFNQMQSEFDFDFDRGLETVVPLMSKFYDWCLEYYKEAQMSHSDDDEPGSLPYATLMWRKQRNDEALEVVDAQAEVAAGCRWNQPICQFRVHGTPLKTVFHQFDPHMAICDEGSRVQIWDWRRRQMVVSFNNGNPKNASITSLAFANEEVGGILIVSSADGNVRLYRNYDPLYGDGGKLELVSGWRAVSVMTKVTRGAGVVTDWNQNMGRLLAGGDSEMITGWDAVRERFAFEVNTGASSPVTSIVSNWDNHGRTFVAGFGSGTVKLFDTRARHTNVAYKTFREHSSSIVAVRSQSRGDQQIISASVDGHVQMWDFRYTEGPLSRWEVFREGIAAFDMHPQARVFAATSSTLKTWRNQTISIHSIQKKHSDKADESGSRLLSEFALSSGLQAPSNRLPSAFYTRQSSLAFHPNEMMYSWGFADGTVRLYGCRFGEKVPIIEGATGALSDGANSTNPSLNGYRRERPQSMFEGLTTTFRATSPR